MQAFRAGALAQGSLQVIRGGSRGSSGLGWYQRYKRLGPDAFRKARAPNPFDWETSSGENSGGKGPALDKRRRRRAFFDMAVDGVAAGRVEFELAADILPVTCENFLRLCKGVDVSPVKRAVRVSVTGEILEQDEAEEEQDAAGDPEMTLGYEGTLIHQVVTGTGIMGGDVEGTGGSRSHSGFGTRFFPDEAFLIPHTQVPSGSFAYPDDAQSLVVLTHHRGHLLFLFRSGLRLYSSAPGLLTTANPGVHRNGSQFYITTEPAGHLDGRSVAFGRVASGMEVVRALYGMYSIRGKPVSEITVAKCGEIAANPAP